MTSESHVSSLLVRRQSGGGESALNLSDGAIIGIVIGGFFVFVLISVCCFIFCLKDKYRGKRRRQNPQPPNHRYEGPPAQEKGPFARMMGKIPGRGRHDVENGTSGFGTDDLMQQQQQQQQQQPNGVPEPPPAYGDPGYGRPGYEPNPNFGPGGEYGYTNPAYFAGGPPGVSPNALMR